MNIRIPFLLGLGLLPLACGCVNVQPWEREALAEPIMQPDRGALARTLGDHMFFSREEANGGRGVGGGGCGCN